MPQILLKLDYAKITDEYVLTRLNTMGKLALLMLKDLDDAVKEMMSL